MVGRRAARLAGRWDQMGQSGAVRIFPRGVLHVPHREFTVLRMVKRILLWLGIAFVVYTVIAAPATAAQAVREAFGGISSGGQALGDFFDALIS
jgi:hypothetical protein